MIRTACIISSQGSRSEVWTPCGGIKIPTLLGHLAERTQKTQDLQGLLDNLRDMAKRIMHLRLGCRILCYSLLIVPTLSSALGFEQPGPATDVPLRREAVVVHRGFEIDASLVTGRHDAEALEASAKQQVDIVLSVALRPDFIDFFRQYRVKLVPGLSNHGRYSKDQGVALGASSMSVATPVLLHEYLHAFHDEKLPGGRANPDILLYYRRAKAIGAYPTAAYMLRNPGEFFAMTASAYLYGRIARPPCDRATVRATQPYYYRYLSKLFELAESDLRPEPAVQVGRACRTAVDLD
jgi:hypothetical protein